MDLPTFNPSPVLADAVLDDLANPALSARDAAARANTTLPALSRWFARDDIQQAFLAITAAADALTNHVAAAQLPAVAQAAARVVHDFNSRPRPAPTAPDTPPDLDALAANLRATNHMLRAGHLLLRLARFSGDAPRRARAHPADPEGPPPSHRRRVPSPIDDPTRDELLALAADFSSRSASAATSPPFPEGRGRGKGDDSRTNATCAPHTRDQLLALAADLSSRVRAGAPPSAPVASSSPQAIAAACEHSARVLSTLHAVSPVANTHTDTIHIPSAVTPSAPPSGPAHAGTSSLGDSAPNSPPAWPFGHLPFGHLNTPARPRAPASLIAAAGAA